MGSRCARSGCHEAESLHLDGIGRCQWDGCDRPSFIAEETE